ncbi:hypothetical protein VPHD479_0080 [Vibrio phage D479]
MAKKTTSASQKGCYARYKGDNRALTNKVAKLERHIKVQPDDGQAIASLQKLKGSNYSGRVKASRQAGRLTRPAKEFKQLTKLAKAGLNEAMHQPKEVRELQAKVRRDNAASKGRKPNKTRKQKRAAK